jgi:pyrimidine-nucleoside phosphorylase
VRILEIIEKKRDGLALTAKEIQQFVQAYMAGEIPDYQAAALLMAIFIRGMNHEETVALTDALVHSGEILDFSASGRLVADKHSTGGVGDKTTLVLLPLAAAAGVTIAKMSGRGLGHTGGTIDKLAAIPGFRTNLTQEEFLAQVDELGVALTGQTPHLTPADGQLYALRDVTATVDSIPLIASSVMSKKIASGAQSIVLDVKMGSGAFMRDLEGARELARTMTAIGTALGRRTTAFITAMEQPLGRTVGNHLEVVEAFETLHGRGPADLTELVLTLAAEMLLAGSLASSHEEALAKLNTLLEDGSALEMMRRFIAAQGGDPAVVDEPARLGIPRYAREVRAVTSGYVTRLDARKVGQTAVLLGAGRERKDAEIDLLAGIKLHKKIGDYVEQGDLLAEIFTGTEEKLPAAAAEITAAYEFAAQKPAAKPLIIERFAADKL